MSKRTVLLERAGSVATITLNRPLVGNTVNMDLAVELERGVDAVAEDVDVRCMVITGAGKLFCGGGDLESLAGAGENASAFLFNLATTFHRSIEKLSAMPKPLVVLANGPAAGAGLSLLLTGDLVIAARSAHFTAAYGSVGLTPDGGMSWLLPRLVGLRRAQEIMLTNRRIGADEAAAIGLVTRVVADTDLIAEGTAAALALSEGPVAALAGTRALLTQAFANDLPTQLRAEAIQISNAGSGVEAKEGIGAFMDRRRPKFIGKDIT